MKARLGIAPIAWWNDDLAELSGDISLEGCLGEAREAGFNGRRVREVCARGEWRRGGLLCVRVRECA